MNGEPTVGLVGTGRMGEAIGRRLLETGHRIVVHNRTRAKAAGLCDADAEWADSPAEVTKRADLVLTVLFDERAVQETYLGPHGLLCGPKSTLLVEMSTIRATTTRAVAGDAAARGYPMLDVAIAGPPAAAMEGRLLLLAGGDERDVAAARPVLSAVGRRLVHLGPTGSGVTMKLVLMHTMGTYFASLAEALAVGLRLGLNAGEMLDVILDSHGAPPVLRDRAEALLAELADQPGSVGFPVAGVRKDLEAVLATAADARVAAPVAASALATFTAAAAAGFADRDLVSVVAHLSRQTDRAALAP